MRFGHRRGKTEGQIGGPSRFMSPYKTLIGKNNIKKTFSKKLDNALLTVILVYFFVNQPEFWALELNGKRY